MQKKFNEIRQKGWIRSVCLGSSGVGITFEQEIGLNSNELAIPDFQGIEIKTKRDYSKYYTTLFSATFDGDYLFENKRIRETYGWPDATFRNCKVIYCETVANGYTKLGYKNWTKLDIDWKKRKIYFLIYNKNYELLEREASWSFDLLEEKLLRKLKYLAFVDAKSKYINHYEYFKYTSIHFYSLKNFEEFIKLIADGIIKVNINFGVYKTGSKMGKNCDHGISFTIKRDDLELMYDRIYI